MSPTTLLVGTAGHVDHGKTRLVEALTGVNLDKLPAEQDRGITIELGFAHVDLDANTRLSWIDVPGHERLVRTMVAGASGLDAVVLCVSAVDGVMPQTREHLDILQLLGVLQGLVVLTMADLVDDEQLELATLDVADVVEGSFLDGAPVIAFSSVTLAGDDELRDALRRLSPAPRRLDTPFRLPVDRVFSKSGHGTVVTGTAHGRPIRVGATLRLQPANHECRVRAIQTHGRDAKTTRDGHRTALNLAGDLDDLERGSVLADSEIPCPHIVDVSYEHLDSAPPLQSGAAVRVHHGTTTRSARIILADNAPWAQLRLDGPLPCHVGDRFLVRRLSPAATLGGGIVLDPWAPKRRTCDNPDFHDHMRRLQDGDGGVYLERSGCNGIRVGDPRNGHIDDAVKRITLGDRVFAPGVVRSWLAALLASLGTFHRQHPLRPGARAKEVQKGLLLQADARIFERLVAHAVEHGRVALTDGMLRLPDFSVSPSEDVERAASSLLQALQKAGWKGQTARTLADVVSDDPLPLLHLLERRGAAHEIPALGWVSADIVQATEQHLRTWFAEKDSLSPADFKTFSGLSRKGAIPWLEWCDKTRRTIRRGNERSAGPALQT